MPGITASGTLVQTGDKRVAYAVDRERRLDNVGARSRSVAAASSMGDIEP